MNTIVKLFVTLFEGILVLNGLAQVLILPVAILYGIYYALFHLFH